MSLTNENNWSNGINQKQN